MKYYAHSKEGEPPECWQLLREHLVQVSNMAEDFASFFNASTWGRILGENHDIGKGTNEWQAWLRHVNNVEDTAFSKFYIGHVKHAMHGARWLYDYLSQAGKLLSYCIAGHHGGLSNWSDQEGVGLKSKLAQPQEKIDISLRTPKIEKNLPFSISDGAKRFGFQLQFFARMIFSCLVDADYLDTEAFLDKEKNEWRSQYPSVEELCGRFWPKFDSLRQSAAPTPVNKQREIVLNNCLEAAKQEPGLFSLTVPTGGGKTLSSMAFALEHAKKYHKRRIIYVIPFTTVIEQNAAVFRDVLGKDAVLEHHCNFIPEDSDWKTRLATENWDAPVIVTTNVQFFNSFFSRKPSKCRKLHNVADSVVIFDEVQSVPVEKLKPCLEVLKELTMNYDVSAVLCTATQPAIGQSDEFPSGLQNVSEIIQDVPSMFKRLKRTKEKFVGEIDISGLRNGITSHEQALCIVNTRQQALDIFNALPEAEGNFHLSALMYPSHRTQKFKEIRTELAHRRPCRLISTQLIEAGVDVDFPVVFRATAGMDSIAQAAGRCNREGRNDKGQVHLFKFKEETPHPHFRQTAQCAELLFDKFSGQLLEPGCIHEYFLHYYWLNTHRMDEDNIVETCNSGQQGNIQFKDIARFQMIKTATCPIIIALEDEAISLVDQLNFMEYSAPVLRGLQQYTVQVYPYQLADLDGWLEQPKPGIFVLQSPELYSDQTGLICKPPEGAAFFG
ncbi:MAG: CRISPR-associated helicase Cas3' [Thermodesulfobacteriota bacterium]|nr:CRISPR-associated helicase Cas3' [Thermodesulfobacteriota bacterium]